MKRLYDIVLAIIASIILMVPMLIIAIAVKVSSSGPILHWSKRFGKNNEFFQMPKFRTMRLDTPNVATHLLENPELYLTRIGKILRNTSLDELPQLICIISGKMSFVGPRPALFNQYDLIDLRTSHSVHLLKPGLTGLAQINGRDEISISEKVNFDIEYCENQSLLNDIGIMWATFLNVISREGITH